MKKDHILFLLTLVLIFISPKFPIGQYITVLPDKSGISLGLLGFIIWAAFRPLYLIRIPNKVSSTLLWVFFALYILIISFISFNLSSIAYALQFFLYSYFVIFLIGNYLWRAQLHGEIPTMLRIIAFVSVVYGLGSIISVFTGPIYPHQVMAHARLWDGKWLQQGVGFGVNQNGVGGILLFFISFAWFCWQKNSLKEIAVLFILFVAIISTMSRSAIVALAISIIFTMMMTILALIFNYYSISLKRFTTCLLILIIVMLTVFSGIQFNGTNNDYLAWMFKEGFAAGDVTDMLEGESARFTAWEKGIDNWSESGSFHLLFGQGMKASSSFNSTNWNSPHNLYIAFLGDFGLLGFLLFLLVILYYFYRSLTLSLSGNRIGFFGLFFLTGLLFHNMTECFLYGIEYVIILLITFLIINLKINKPVCKNDKR